MNAAESAAGAELRAKLLGQGIPADALPPVIPVPIPENYLFSGDFAEAEVPGLGQYSLFQLGADQVRLDVKLVALGTVPGGNGALYCLDLSTGQVILVDVAQKSVTGVNSTFKAFIAFVNTFNDFLGASPTVQALARNAGTLREWMERNDPAAFDDSRSESLWWPAVVTGLENGA